MKTKPIPAIVMLVAGFVTCVISIYTHMELKAFTKTLFWVLVIFYIFGIVIKVILDRNFKEMQDEEVPEEETESEEEASSEDETQEELQEASEEETVQEENTEV